VESTEAGRQGSDADAERLRRIEMVTDVALAQLDVEDLLDELLLRVRDALDADLAAVLLVDEATGELVVTASVGIDDSGSPPVRIPAGVGFAGRIAAEAKPIVLAEVGDADVYNPNLRRQGVRTLMGVPLVAEGRVTGVLHVGTWSPRQFDDEDVAFLQMVADRAAHADDARRSQVAQTAAAALQRSLIPTRLPTVPGLELAARYLPSVGGVGGDWYDVLLLPGGQIGVVMGDVVGRGLTAAVIMGRLRSALRAYSLETVDPADVLERLDRKLQHFEPGQMTTVLYVVVDVGHETVQLSSAGHPLPVLLTPDEGPTLVEAEVDLPLGVSREQSRRRATVEMPPGALLALFTDGLVERRGEVLDAGFDRLCEALTIESAEQSCRAAVADLIPTEGWSDDAALLVIRREPGGPAGGVADD
jgi:sigma-B regulation protein RsbU (phosphoserine phosphatase)